ncbi:PREDICTED: neutrophil cationic peptide 2-like [Chinchilla lanigera]|uniref:Neutrophil cationic peptide 2-like n=1 Tax=Chinchilla lanigera TaxID=34839 RepID=A0A8C2YSV9_CHILA|nr:PREDICTED: neutrophil cationic peptide 2-like [Chinchilla lanigera]
MKTLAVFAAFSLLALLAWAEPHPGRADQPDPKILQEEEDQVAVISFPGEESTALQDAGARAGRTCYCRLSACRFRERTLGICRYQNRIYRFCC